MVQGGWLAELLIPNSSPRTLTTSFWPVDKVVLAYFTFACALIFAYWQVIPDAALLFGAHLIATAALVYEVKRPNPSRWIFRNWYMLFYVGACYKEMAILIPPIRKWTADLWLADLDFRIWNANPTVWMERIYSPVLTEYLQVMYTLFIPAVLFVAFLLWKQRKFPEFQYYAFLIALGFLASYIGYLFVPARGPRFLLNSLQHIPLQGMWGFNGMQHALDRLESAHYDCFPSGHTELTVLAWWGSRMVSKRLFQVYFAYTPSIIFATVYLRYHYTVDVMAGATLAIILIVASPQLYRLLQERV